MTFIIALIGTIALMNGAAAAAEECEVPQSLISNESDFTRVMQQIKDHHQLDISVVGSGSSGLPGPDGARYAYPARLEDALRQRLPGTGIKVTAHVQPKERTTEMVSGMGKILTDDKPALVIWQAGTVDALSGIEPEDFRNSLDDGVDKIRSAKSDVILMNMQYSPRTESMLNVSSYADIMHLVSQQHDVALFDRLAIMRYWNDEGTFDLYATTKNYDMARKVHDCIGRALASQIINSAHLDTAKVQTTP